MSFDSRAFVSNAPDVAKGLTPWLTRLDGDSLPEPHSQPGLEVWRVSAGMFAAKAVDDDPKKTDGKPGGDKPAAPDKPADGKGAVQTPDYPKVVGNLGDDSFHKREAAQKALIESGAAAVPAVYAVRNSDDLEVRRRTEEILNRLAGTLELKELMKAPQLLGYLPQWSLSDRRDQQKRYIAEQPDDNSRKKYLERMITEADFTRLNPDYVKGRIKQLEERNKRNDLPLYEYEQNDRFISSLKDVKKLAAEIRLDCIGFKTDMDEKRRLAIEALEICPETIVDQGSMRMTLQQAGLFKDPKFVDAFVKADGDPSWAEGDFYKWEEVDRALDNRLERVRKDTSEKKTEKLIKTLHMVAAANESHGSLEKAVRCYEEELDLKKKLTPADTGLRTEFWRLGELQIRTKRIDGAIKSFEIIHEMEKEKKDLGQNELGVLDKLITLYTAKGDKRKAIELDEEAIKRGHYQTYEMDKLAERHMRIAQSMEGLKDQNGAESHLKESVRVLTLEGKDYNWAAKSFVALADFYVRQDKQAEAVPFYRRAVNATSDNRFDRDHVPTLKKLIACLEKVDPRGEELVEMRKKLAAREK